MNLKPWLSPLLILVTGGAWLGWNQSKIAELQTQLDQSSVGPRTKITPPQKKPSPSVPYSYLLESGKLDWDLISQISMGNVTQNDLMIHGERAMLRVRLQLKTMQPTELLTMLGKLPDLDLSSEDYSNLEKAAIFELSTKAPKEAIRLLEGDFTKNISKLSKAFRNWSTIDPAEASRWLDRQIETHQPLIKELNPGMSPLHSMEKRLAGDLIKNHPRLLEQRLAKMPDSEAVLVAQQLALTTKTLVNQRRLLTLARERFSDGKALNAVIGNLAFRASELTLDDASSAIQNLELKENEVLPYARRIATDYTVNNFKNPDDLDPVLSWLQKEIPAKAGELTAETLAKAFWQNHEDPNHYEPMLAKASSLNSKTDSHAILDKFVDETVSLKADRFGIQPRLKSVTDPQLKVILKETFDRLVARELEKK